MDSIQDFIQSAAQSLGVSGDVTERATGGLLSYIKGKADGGEYQRLISSIPGADALAPKGSGAASTFGSLVGKLGGKLGGNLGSAASVVGIFDRSGLDPAKAGQLVTMFFGFAKDKAGGELIDQILGKAPEVKKLIK